MAELSTTFWDLLVALEYWFSNLALYVVIAAAVWGLLIIPVVFDRFNFESGYGNFASRMLILLMGAAGACSLFCVGGIGVFGMPSRESAKYTFYHILIYGVATVILWQVFSKVIKHRFTDQLKYEDVRSRFLMGLLLVACTAVGLAYFHIGILPFPV